MNRSVHASGQSFGLLVALLTSGCAGFQYEPRLLARGEMTVRTTGPAVEFRAGGQRIARSLTLYDGLSDYVRCVPQALTYANRAHSSSVGAAALSGGAALFGLLGFGFLIRDAATYDAYKVSGCSTGDGNAPQCTVIASNEPLSGRAFALSLLGTVLAGFSLGLRYRATGQALDAMNYYNDAVGSLGATCAQLRYPLPVALTPQGLSAATLATETTATPAKPAAASADPNGVPTATPPVRRQPGIHIKKLVPTPLRP